MCQLASASIGGLHMGDNASSDIKPLIYKSQMKPISWIFLLQVQNAGFSAPTPIQAQSWPIALQSKDIVAIAKTGSGKTLGYLLPAFIHLKRTNNNAKMGPTVLVLSPTRELATQIQDEAVKFSKTSRIACTVSTVLIFFFVLISCISMDIIEFYCCTPH